MERPVCVNGVSPLGTLVFFVHQILSFFYTLSIHTHTLYALYTGGRVFVLLKMEKNVRDKPHNTIMFG